MKRITLLLLSLVCFSQISGQNQSAGITRSDNEINLMPFAQVFVDSSDAFTLDSFISQGFTPLPELLLTGAAHTFWVRIRLKNDLQTASDWRLKLYDEWCENVDVYSRDDTANGTWFHQRAGNLCPISELDQHGDLLYTARKMPNEISLSLSPGVGKQLFIRYKCQNRPYLKIQPRLKPLVLAAVEGAAYNYRMFLTVALISALWVLAMYHLFFFFMVHDNAYLYYALYGLSAPIAVTLMDDYNIFYYHILFKNHPIIQPWVFNSLGIIAVACYILFTRSFLRTRVRFPRLDKAILLLLSLALGSGVIGNINFHLTQRQYLPGMPFEALIVMITVVFGFLLWSIWKEKKKTDIFYLLGVGIILITVVPKYLFFLFHEPYEKMAMDWLYPGIIQAGLVMELLFFAIGLGYRTRQVQLEKQRYAELDEMKSRFFANISHEFRTPLTLILGPVKQIKEYNNDPKTLSLLGGMETNANRLLKLINQILDLAKLEAKKMKLHASERNFIPHLKGIVHSYESLAKQKGTELSLSSSTDKLLLYYDSEKMESVLYNLISNALKFTPKGGRVSIELIENRSTIELYIRDTGVGIAADRLDKIFDRFFQDESSGETRFDGSGIGLAIVKELVHLHHGKISVDSEPGAGTIFLLELPLGKGHLEPREIVKRWSSNELSSVPDIDIVDKIQTSKTPESTIPEDAPQILLIEDNYDVRAYIRQYLDRDFHVMEAEDGIEGIKKARTHNPDIIISDVMMPKKNGYEVCHILKSDIRTSHIPIILLTAKAAQEEKLEGLETGADDYLVKPFESRELVIRIQNLIRLRQKLRERFASAISLKPSEVVTNSLDQIFLDKAMKTVEMNIQNDKFNIDMLAKELNMSKPNLNRKLRALLHQSTNQFIQSIRLQRAAQLLGENAGTVSEIAFQTGFSGTAYFVKCFKETYGTTPGQFVKQEEE